MLKLKQVTLVRGQKKLLTGVNLQINDGENVGIVGHNGVGKSSLFKLIKQELDCDHGSCELTNGVRIAEISQEIPNGTAAAMTYVLSGDLELTSLYQQLTIAEQAGDGVKIAQLHARLAEIEGYRAESRAAKILRGLGFKQTELYLPISTFSGGWRMRLNLAKVLMQPSDLLLLDEPTNHLDLEAIFWLENWLTELKQTVLIISHDRTFLDQVVNKIIHLKEGQLKSFTGNYTAFEEQYALLLTQQQTSFSKQQKQIKHLQSFVDRFRYKSSKAKQAQSRIKMLARMEKVAAVQLANPFNFSFKSAASVSNPMINLDKVKLGYQDKLILTKVNLSIQPSDRLALLGPNGAGKSTLIKALARELPIAGEYTFSPKIKIGYFTQHQIEALDINENQLWHLKKITPNALEKDMREFLGGFNFHGDRVFEPICNFSGGEKARLALALLVWQQPNLLLLDEPSNHLDLDMRAALVKALQMYDGALILISHDRYLLESLANEFYLVANGEIKPFAGNLRDYQVWLNNDQNTAKAKKMIKAKQNKKSTMNQEEKLVKLEQLVAKKQQILNDTEQLLANADLYQNNIENKKLLLEYQTKTRTLTTEIGMLEEQIFLIVEEYCTEK